MTTIKTLIINLKEATYPCGKDVFVSDGGRPVLNFLKITPPKRERFDLKYSACAEMKGAAVRNPVRGLLLPCISVFTYTLILSAAFILLSGCSNHGQDDSGTDGIIAGNTRVTIRAERDAMIRNPLNGWVMYLGRSWDENFWTDPDSGYSPYDEMPTSEGTTVRVSDYSNTAYLRTSWASLEPTEGNYVWRDPDSRYSKMLKSCTDRGLRLAFRIVIDGRDQGQNTPEYVFDTYGAKAYTNTGQPVTSGYTGYRSPYPDDENFQRCYEKFLTEFARDFNDFDVVDFVDGFSLGKWGEAHALIFQDNANKLPVFEWMTDLYSRLFTEVPLFVNYHRLLGDADQSSWQNTPSPDTEGMIESAVGKGYGIRHDAFGMYTYYKDWERGIVAEYNFRCPVIMEGGWITDGTHRYWNSVYPDEPYEEDRPDQVRQGEYDMSQEARVNMMDFRVHHEIQTFFEMRFDLVKSFIADGGYRLCPSIVTVPETAAEGSSVTLTSRWSNYGWGYCPNNLPSFGYRFKGAFALLDREDNVVKVFVDEQIEPSEWLLNSPTEYTTEIDLSGVPAGQYMWAIGIVDTKKDNVPGLNLAVTSSRLTAGGWVKIIGLSIE